MNSSDFIRGNDRLNKILENKELAAEVSEILEEMNQEDRRYALNSAL